MSATPLQCIWLLVLGNGEPAATRPSTLAILVVGFGVVLAVLLLIRLQWRRGLVRAAHRVAAEIARDRIEAVQGQAESSSSLHQTVAEATELAQRLELLLERADRVIARLETVEKRERTPDPGKAPGLTGPADAGDGDTPDPATRQIYALADQGLEPVEIAQRLDQHLGKVQLILALRRA